MAGKEQMMEELGNLLLPNLVNEALVANDRAKYRMTLLQAGRDHADHPDDKAADLKQERIACGVTNAGFDAVVARSFKEDSGAYHIPESGRVCERIVDDLQAMLAPLEAAFGSGEGGCERVAEYRRRRRSSGRHCTIFAWDGSQATRRRSCPITSSFSGRGLCS
jgi:hypothetical protein